MGLRFPTGRDSSVMPRESCGTSYRPCPRAARPEAGRLIELTSLDTQAMENAVDHRELVQISEALDDLLKVEPALAEIVDLKFFCGSHSWKLPPCGTFRNVRCSDTGRKRAFISIARFALTCRFESLCPHFTPTSGWR